MSGAAESRLVAESFLCGWSFALFSCCWANSPLTSASTSTVLTTIFIPLSLSGIAGLLWNINQIGHCNLGLVISGNRRLVSMALCKHLFARSVRVVAQQKLFLLRQRRGRGKNRRSPPYRKSDCLSRRLHADLALRAHGCVRCHRRGALNMGRNLSGRLL